MTVAGEDAEEAIAAMLELFPEGFAEGLRGGAVELVAFTDEAGAELLRARFGDVETRPVSSGWEEEWKRFHRAVEVGPLWIGPPWQRPTAGLEAVVIDPGRAFGTGGHSTTLLCVELLVDLDRGSVLDIGCGSGILAIAAAKLGFAPVLAIDFDEAAVEAATRNAAANDAAVEVRLLDAASDELPSAEIVLANIDRRAIELLAPPCECEVLVTSGYYEHQRPSFEGFVRTVRKTEGQWAADLFERQ